MTNRTHPSVDYSACEKIFDILKSKDGTVKKSHFANVLKDKGILSDDPRIKDVFVTLEGRETISNNLFALSVSQGRWNVNVPVAM